jgi:uncharacterized MnhB-related membrane protein
MLEIILLIILVLAILSLQFKDLLSAIISLAAFSLMLSLLFYYLHAPDVAIAEAAVGAGVATTLFVLVVSRTKRRER